MKTSLAILLACVMGSGLSACIVHGHGRGHTGVAVVIPVAHVHDDSCGHYHLGDSWYHHQGHRHSSNCGHVYIGGRWTLRIE